MRPKSKHVLYFLEINKKVLVLRAAQSLSLGTRDAQPAYIHTFILRDRTGETLCVFSTLKIIHIWSRFCTVVSFR